MKSVIKKILITFRKPLILRCKYKDDRTEIVIDEGVVKTRANKFEIKIEHRGPYISYNGFKGAEFKKVAGYEDKELTKRLSRKVLIIKEGYDII